MMQRESRLGRRTVLGLSGMAVALMAGLGAAQAAPLEIDGVLIADEALWRAAQDEGALIYYTTQGESAYNALLAPFIKATGLDVEVVASTAARMYERTLSEAGAGMLEADIVLTTDIVLARGLAEKGIWAPYEPIGWADLDAEFKAADGGPYWTPMQSVNAMAYNSELVSEADAPKKWTDLLDPKWKDRKIAVSQISGGSNWARWLWLRETYGLEHWQALAAQKPAIGDTNGATLDLLARGEVLVAANLPSNVAQAMADGASVKLIIPEDGMIAFNQYVGLGATAKHPNAGKVFLNWLLSPKGQEAIAVELGNYPVIKGAPAPVIGAETLPAREDTLVVQPTADGLINNRESYQQEWLRMMGMAG